ncbi:MAG: hypothetical protein ACP6IU_14215 [Candidatus Asgardarchaeia archaeon]
MRRLNDTYKQLLEEAKLHLREAKRKNDRLQKENDTLTINVLSKDVLDSCLNAIEASIRACIIAMGLSFGKRAISQRFGEVVKAKHTTLFSLFFSKLGQYIPVVPKIRGVKLTQVPFQILDNRNILYPGASTLPSNERKKIANQSCQLVEDWLIFIEQNVIPKVKEDI